MRTLTFVAATALVLVLVASPDLASAGNNDGYGGCCGSGPNAGNSGSGTSMSNRDANTQPSGNANDPTHANAGNPFGSPSGGVGDQTGHTGFMNNKSSWQ